MRSLRPILALLTMCCLVWATPAARADDVALTADASFAAEVIRLTNIERTSRGLLPLREQSQLNAAAQAHSEDMAAGGFMSHTGSDGKQFDTRVARTGYQMWGGAENVAAAFPTPDSVVLAWMNSPGHRAAILSPDYREIGVGHAVGSHIYRFFWTQVFSTRRGTLTAFVNDDAATTNTRDVTLHLAAPTEMGTNVSVQISEDPTFAGASSQPWAARVPFQLSEGNGEKRVYVRFANATTTTIAEDTIQFNLAGLQLSTRDVRITVAQDGTTLPRSVVIRVSDGGNPIRVLPAIAVPWLSASNDADGNLVLTITDPSALAALGSELQTSVVVRGDGASTAATDETIRVTVRVVARFNQVYLPATTR